MFYQSQKLQMLKLIATGDIYHLNLLLSHFSIGAVGSFINMIMSSVNTRCPDSLDVSSSDILWQSLVREYFISLPGCSSSMYDNIFEVTKAMSVSFTTRALLRLLHCDYHKKNIIGNIIKKVSLNWTEKDKSIQNV